MGIDNHSVSSIPIATTGVVVNAAVGHMVVILYKICMHGQR